MHPKCAGCHAAPDMGNGSSTLTSGSSGWHLVQANPANANAKASSDAGGKATPAWWCPKCWRKRRASLRKSA